jgi:excisionase family DNA binding protein
MSLEHSPARQRKRAPQPPVPAVAVTVNEFSAATRLSKPTVYRMMQVGKLRYAQIGGTRRIPVTEYTRLGLTDGEAA